MTTNSIRMITRFWALFALLGLLAGCDSGGGRDGEYDGNWSGTTSHGGTVAFTVDGDWISDLSVTDSEASIWILQPVEIEGDTFQVHNSEDALYAGSPEATVTGLFSSETQCSGNYLLRQSTQTWTGTFTATRQ